MLSRCLDSYPHRLIFERCWWPDMSREQDGHDKWGMKIVLWQSLWLIHGAMAAESNNVSLDVLRGDSLLGGL